MTFRRKRDSGDFLLLKIGKKIKQRLQKVFIKGNERDKTVGFYKGGKNDT